MRSRCPALSSNIRQRFTQHVVTMEFHDLAECEAASTSHIVLVLLYAAPRETTMASQFVATPVWRGSVGSRRFLKVKLVRADRTKYHSLSGALGWNSAVRRRASFILFYSRSTSDDITRGWNTVSLPSLRPRDVHIRTILLAQTHALST